MLSFSHQEEALTRDLKHPSHSDPFRVWAYLGGATFFGTLVGVFVLFPEINLGVAAIAACLSSATISFAAAKIERAYKRNRDAAYFEAKREEDRIRTEKAIAEMKRAEGE